MSRYNWNYIRNIKRFGYLLLVVNIVLGILLVSDKAKSQLHHTVIDSKVKHIHAKRGVKLRLEPKANSAYNVAVPDGGSVVILDTAEVNGWFKVSYNGNEGYVWNEYVED